MGRIDEQQQEEENSAEEEGSYPTLIEITRRLQADLGGRVSGTPTEVVDAACKELNISTEGTNIVERAQRAYDQLYGAPTQAAGGDLDVEVSIADGGGGGDSFEGVERVDMAARKQQADRELRFDDENDGNESPAIEEETSPTALQVDGGRAVAVRAVHAVDLQRARLVRHVVRVEDERLGDHLEAAELPAQVHPRRLGPHGVLLRARGRLHRRRGEGALLHLGPGLLPQGGRRARGRGQGVGEGPVAVSYTHLTLPTKA